MRTFFNQLHLILSLQCQRASELTSESFERSLLRHERIALAFHKLTCWSCRQFEKQLRFLRLAMQRLKNEEDAALSSGEVLDPSFKERLKQLKP